jgi:hypothetical protein
MHDETKLACYHLLLLFVIVVSGLEHGFQLGRRKGQLHLDRSDPFAKRKERRFVVGLHHFLGPQWLHDATANDVHLRKSIGTCKEYLYLRRVLPRRVPFLRTGKIVPQGLFYRFAGTILLFAGNTLLPRAVSALLHVTARDDAVAKIFLEYWRIIGIFAADHIIVTSLLHSNN